MNYYEMYSVEVSSGDHKGEKIDKATLGKPLSDYTNTYALKLTLFPKKVLISSTKSEQVFISNKVIKTKEAIELTSVYEVQQKDGKTVQKNLEEDVPNLMKNVVNLIQTQTSGDAVKTVFESYERSITKVNKEESRKLEKTLKEKKVGDLDHDPLFILGEVLKKEGGVKEVTYSTNETAASVFSMVHLSTMFGQNYGKGLYQLD